jgi:hypothetical protein
MTYSGFTKLSTIMTESKFSQPVLSATDQLQAIAKTANDEITIHYISLSELSKKFADRNPKVHDIEAICDSIQRHGFKDALEYDSALNDGNGGIVAGNGRLEALLKLRDSGARAPRGIKATEEGDWLIPVQFGVSSQSESEGLAYLIANNNLSLMGGDLTALDASRLYDADSYVSLLQDLAKTGSLPISVDGDDLDLLISQLNETPEDPGFDDPDLRPDLPALECRCPQCGFEFNPKAARATTQNASL